MGHEKQEHDLAILELSCRSYNCLRRAGIDTVEQLLGVSEEQLLDIRNFGETSLREVRAKIEGFVEMKSEQVTDESVDLIGLTRDKMGYTARDKLGNPVRLGSLVKFMREYKSGTRECVGTVKEIAFKIDGSTFLRVDGFTTKPVDSRSVEIVKLNDRESLIIEEFSKRGVRLELADARNLAAMLSFPFTSSTGEDDTDEVEDARTGNPA